MEDGILDFAVLIIVLAVCISIGYNIIVNSAKSTYEKSIEGSYDKTMGAVSGILIQSDNSPGFSRAEAIIATEVQDYRLPLPTKMTIGNNDPYYITGRHPAMMKDVAYSVWEIIKDDPAETRYDFIYEYGNQFLNTEMTKNPSGEINVNNDYDVNETYKLVRLNICNQQGTFTLNKQLEEKLSIQNKNIINAEEELRTYKESLSSSGNSEKYNRIKYMNAQEYDKAIKDGELDGSFQRLPFINKGFTLKINIAANEEIGTIQIGTKKIKVLNSVAGRIGQSDIRVKTGDTVAVGDIIAYIHF